MQEVIQSRILKDIKADFKSWGLLLGNWLISNITLPATIKNLH